MGRWDQAAAEAMARAKAQGIWGYEEEGHRYCVDCWGGQGSVPSWEFIRDDQSTTSVVCEHCGDIGLKVIKRPMHW